MYVTIPRLRQNVSDLETMEAPWGIRSSRRVDKDPEAAQIESLNAVARELADPQREDSVNEQLYSFVRYWEYLSPRVKGAVIDAIVATLSEMASPDSALGECVETFRMLTYLLAYLVVTEERAASEAANVVVSTKGTAAKKSKAGGKKAATSSSSKGKKSKGDKAEEEEEEEDGDEAKAEEKEQDDAAEEEEEEEDAGNSRKKKTTTTKKKKSVVAFDWIGCYRDRALRGLVGTLVAGEEEEEEEQQDTNEAGETTKGKKTTIWVDLNRVGFETGLPDEGFLGLHWQVGEAVMENNNQFRAGTTARELVVLLIAASATRFYDVVGVSVVTSLTNLVRAHEHASAPVCEVLMSASSRFGDARLATDVIQEFAGDSAVGNNKTSAGFVEDLTRLLPGLVLANVSMLLPALNSEAHQVRVPVIHAIGHLVVHLKSISPTTAGTGAAPDTRTRDNLLQVLADRTHDVSTFGRSAALGAWCAVAEAGAIPLSHVGTVTDLAVERLMDRGALVRKQALGLLTALVEHNPYAPVLAPEAFVTKVQEVQAWITANGYGTEALALEERRNTQGGMNSSSGGGDETSHDDDDDQEDEERPVADPETTEREAEISRRMEVIKYAKAALLFILKMQRACEGRMGDLLTSKTTSDVLGALRFLCAAKEFRVPGADAGVRKALRLIWDGRESGAVKRELMEAFERLYVARSLGGNKRVGLPPSAVAASLVDLAANAALDELTSLEQVVAESMRGGDGSVLKRRILPTAAVDALYAVLEDGLEGDASSSSSGDARRVRAAACVVGMAASAAPSTVDRPPFSMRLISSCLQSKRRDMVTARYAMSALLSACDARGGVCALEPEERTAVESAAMGIVCGEWKGDGDDDGDATWFAAAESAMNLLVKVSATPERALETCVRRASARASQEGTASSLSRLFFVIGHVAIKTLVLSETLASSLKKARNGNTNNNKKQTTAEVPAPKNEEEDMVGASAEEETEDLIVRRIAELELVNDPEGLLGSMLPALVRVVTDSIVSSPSPISQGMDPVLAQSAALALCKMMCVSESLCERHLPLIFTVLRDSPHAAVRGNLVVAIGDLAFRFPNSVEPYTAQVYRPLRDSSASVRKNALMVLTHLALNDMIKVRGEVSEVAMRLVDPEERIRDLARLFFSELSRRGTNPIYNLLPEVLAAVSREGGETARETSEDFREVASFLVAFVDKDKQLESTTDKLCHRMHAALGFPGEGETIVPGAMRPADVRLCRDLAFALEQLKPSESAAKRLMEDLFKCYRPALGDAVVYASFSRVAAKSKSCGKSNDFKKSVEDWCARLDRAYEAQSEDVRTAEKARGRSGAARKVLAAVDPNRGAKSSAEIPIGKGEIMVVTATTDGNRSQKVAEKRKAPVRGGGGKKKTTAGRRRKARAAASDDEDENDDDRSDEE